MKNTITLFSFFLLLTSKVSLGQSGGIQEANKRLSYKFQNTSEVKKDEFVMRELNSLPEFVIEYHDDIFFPPLINSSFFKEDSYKTSDNIFINALTNIIEANKKKITFYKKNKGNQSLIKIGELEKENEALKNEIENKKKEEVNEKLKNNRNFISITSTYIKGLASELGKKYTSIIDTVIKKGTKVEELLTKYNEQHKIDLLNIERDLKIQFKRDSAFFVFYQKNIEIVDSLKNINTDIKECNSLIKNFENKFTIHNDDLNFEEKIKQDSLIVTRQSSFSKDLKDIEKKVEKIVKLDNQIISKYNKLASEVMSFNKKIEVDKQKIEKEINGKSKDFGALPALTSVLGQREIVPNLSFTAQQTIKNDKSTLLNGEIRLLVSSPPSNKNITRLENLFIPEASTFGIYSKFLWSFLPKDLIVSNQLSPRQEISLENIKKMGFSLELNYLGKTLQPDTNTNFSISQFHGKLGLEYIVFKNILSIYGNVNTILLADGISKFDEYYDKENNMERLKAFIDFGARMYIPLSTENDVNILIDLNMIAVNPSINSLLKTKDNFIPNIKIGLKTNFGF